MAICVHSEIAPLKKVMLHRPGAELEHLAPRELERLLFDDIPYLKTAQSEHDRFAEILRENGTEVVYLENLVADVLRSDPSVRESFLTQFICEGGPAAQRYREPLYDYLSAIEDPDELVKKTMSGVGMRELTGKIHAPLSDLLQSKSRFILDPIPNLYFTRDPFASIGRGISIHHMYSATRRRETIYGQLLFDHHPDFAGDTPQYYDRDLPFSIEGGDILNLSEEVVAVGISQRTTPEGIELLAQNIFADESSKIRAVLAIDIPSVRAFMHLDTVFTQVDASVFSVHPGVLASIRLYVITPDGNGGLKVRERTEPLEDVLADLLHLDAPTTLIRCGGGDRITSEREQWNDGANTLCIRPGTVIVYDRNEVTNELLTDSGIRVLRMPSSELSRGRGGPRCMSMPLIREA